MTYRRQRPPGWLCEHGYAACPVCDVVHDIHHERLRIFARWGRGPDLSPEALKLLALLRDHPGQWFGMGQLREHLNLDPVGFGEPVVSTAMADIRRAGVNVEMRVAWVAWPRGGRGHWVVYSPDREFHQRAQAGLVRENVWRLP